MNEEYFSLERGSNASPSETPFQTPLTSATIRTSSRNTSGSVNISPVTPPAMPPLDSLPSKGDTQDDLPNSFPQQDFTPSLHASLVSEILSLRRDANSKHDTIEELETALSSTRNENDTLRENATRGAKETRALKRQLQMHEDGSYSTMELLCKERDEVNEINADLRRKIDTLQRKSRSQDEDSRRIYKKLDLDKSKWEKEKRLMERKVAVAENRLKAIVTEFASREVEVNSSSDRPDRTSEDGFGTDRDSIVSFDPQASPPRKQYGSIGSVRELQKSLAEELDFNEDEDTAVEVSDTSWFNEASRERVTSSSGQTESSETTPRSPSKTSPIKTPKRSSRQLEQTGQEDQSPQTNLEDVNRPPEMLKRQSTLVSELVKRFSSSGVPADDIKNDTKRNSKTMQGLDYETQADDNMSEGTKTDLKDVEIYEPVPRPIRRHDRVNSDPITRLDFVSRAQATTLPEIEESATPSPIIDVTSIATQTDPIEFKGDGAKDIFKDLSTSPSRAPPPVPIAVPSIAVQPATAPTSPSQSELGSEMVDAAAQTVVGPFDIPKDMNSVGVQTDRIRIDKRLIKWPSHLRSMSQKERLAATAESGDSSRALSPVPEGSRGKDSVAGFQATTFADRSTQTGLNSPSLRASFAADLGNDNAGDNSLVPRPQKYGVSSVTSETSKFEPEDIHDDAYFSDTESQYPSAKPFNWVRKQQRQSFDPPTTVPEHGKASARPLSFDTTGMSMKGRQSLEKGRNTGKSTTDASLQTSLAGPGKKVGSIHRHSRSPSYGSVTSSSFSKSSGPRPPFVIPLRVSSKKLHSRSSRQTSPSRSRRANHSPSKSGRTSMHSTRRPTLRKSQSAAVVSTGERSEKSHTRGPSHTQPQSRNRSPQKAVQKESPRNSVVENKKAATPTGTATTDMSSQHNVVDAITATTIGEWMWKYMRKGKSFAVADESQDMMKTKSNDARHKRWVWLSPYERTIMWSTKQPTSNAALLGKAGRKLSIQSVLDVKDITAPPKGVSLDSIYCRSIIVLTPSRALKFTAPNHERHYLWLSALSFLAHGAAPNKPLTLPSPLATTIPLIQQDNNENARSSNPSILRVKNSKNGSQPTSGYATPARVDLEAMFNKSNSNTIAQDPDCAFPPTIPRLPHSRKRSVTGPARGRSSFVPGSLKVGSSKGSSSKGGSSHGGSQAPTQSATPTSGHSQVNLTALPQPRSRVESSKSFKNFDTDFTAIPLNPTLLNRDHPIHQSNKSPNQTLPPSRQQNIQPQQQSLTMPIQHHNHHNSYLSDPSTDRDHDHSPRQSFVSADFGGNSNFFDAVGVVRGSTLSKQGGIDLGLTNPATGEKVGGLPLNSHPTANTNASRNSASNPSFRLSALSSAPGDRFSCFSAAPTDRSAGGVSRVPSTITSASRSSEVTVRRVRHGENSDSQESFVGPPDIPRRRMGGVGVY